MRRDAIEYSREFVSGLLTEVMALGRGYGRHRAADRAGSDGEGIETAHLFGGPS